MTWYFMDFSVDDLEPGPQWFGFTYMIQNSESNQTWIGYQQFRTEYSEPVDWRNGWGDDPVLLKTVTCNPYPYTKTIVELATDPEDLLKKYKKLSDAAQQILKKFAK